MISDQSISTLAVSDDTKAVLFALLEENMSLRQTCEELRDQERLVPTDEAMKILGCARKKFWELSSMPGFPNAIQFGAKNHYRLDKLKEFRDNFISEGLTNASN